jgi:hypothetical protein
MTCPCCSSTIPCGTCGLLADNTDPDCPSYNTGSLSGPENCQTGTTGTVTPCNCSGDASVYVGSCSNARFDDVGPEYNDCSCAEVGSVCNNTAQLACIVDGVCLGVPQISFQQNRVWVYVFNTVLCKWVKLFERTPVNTEGTCSASEPCQCPELPTCTAPDCPEQFDGCDCNEFP